MRITRRALASTYVLRHLITAALDFGTGERRSTPRREYDFESEVEDEEDLSPRNGSWTGVRNGGGNGGGPESPMELDRRCSGIQSE